MDGEAWESPTAERTGTEPHEERTSVPEDTPPRVMARCGSEVRRRDVHDAFRQTPPSGPRWGHGADS